MSEPTENEVKQPQKVVEIGKKPVSFTFQVPKSKRMLCCFVFIL